MLFRILLVSIVVARVSGQLSCNRIPITFCCTTRIREQCPEQCASVQCGNEFIHSLFSIDNPISTAKDGNANVGHSSANSFTQQPELEPNPDDGIISISKPDEVAIPPNSGDAHILPPRTSTINPQTFPTLIPSPVWPTTTPTIPSTIEFSTRNNGHRRRTTPDPRIIRPPDSLVVIGDYDEDEPPSENAIVEAIEHSTTTSSPGISEGVAQFSRPRKEIDESDRATILNSGTASTQSGSSAEWKVSIIPRTRSSSPSINPIPPLAIDGKSGDRFNRFYKTMNKVIENLEVGPSGDLHLRNGQKFEERIKLEGSTKDISIESSAKVVPRTTVAPGTTNRVNVVPFRPLEVPSHGLPPAASPPPPAASTSFLATIPSSPSSNSQCGIAPNFTPCVSHQEASKSLLECCKRKNLPPGCQSLCRYDITQAEIRAAMDRGQCGIFNVAPFLECASQGKDNSECCRHRGLVQKTGPQCEQFCRPTQGLTALGIQHIVCGNAVGDMLQCHHSGIRL